MKKTMISVFAVLVLSGCAYPTTRHVLFRDGPRADGQYDNNTFLVDTEKASLEAVKASIGVVVTRTLFRAPNGTTVPTEQIGSGVVIGGRYFVTVEHVVTKNKVEVQTPSGPVESRLPKLREEHFLRWKGKEHALRALYRDDKNDVALFELPPSIRPPSFPYRIGNSDDLKVGNFVYLIGNPVNLGINVREGIVSSLRAPPLQMDNFNSDNTFMVSSGVNPGDSGTLIIAIRDGEYELVGISQGTFILLQRVGWAIRINAILGLLEGRAPDLSLKMVSRE